jgi:hypothetical protein
VAESHGAGQHRCAVAEVEEGRGDGGFQEVVRWGIMEKMMEDGDEVVVGPASFLPRKRGMLRAQDAEDGCVLIPGGKQSFSKKKTVEKRSNARGKGNCRLRQQGAWGQRPPRELQGDA